MSESLSTNEALEAMILFLDLYWERGKSDEIAMLLGSLTLLEDGVCADLALSYDWEECVKKVINARLNKSP